MPKELRVFVRNFKANISVGIYPHEQNKPQPVLINVEMETDIDSDAIDDKIENTVSYESIIQCIRNIEKSGHINLIETIAQKIGQVCLSDAHITQATISVEKTEVFPETDGCGVRLTVKNS